MINKKTLFATALVAGLGFVAFGASTAHAVDGTINITGTVVPQTCKINNNGTGAQATIAVTLPNVLTTALVTNGATAGNTPFAINITNCDSALQKAQTFFSGTQINGTTNNLNNGGSATNVQVRLLNASDSSQLLLGGGTATAQNSPQVTLSGGAATLNYVAQYYSTGNSGAGSVSTSVQFTMQYQ